MGSCSFRWSVNGTQSMRAVHFPMLVMVVLGLFGGESCSPSAAGLTWLSGSHSRNIYRIAALNRLLLLLLIPNNDTMAPARHSIYTEREREREREGKLRRWVCVCIMGKGINWWERGDERSHLRSNNCKEIQDNNLEKANIIICSLFSLYTVLFSSPTLLFIQFMLASRWGGLTMSRQWWKHVRHVAIYHVVFLWLQLRGLGWGRKTVEPWPEGRFIPRICLCWSYIHSLSMARAGGFSI